MQDKVGHQKGQCVMLNLDFIAAAGRTEGDMHRPFLCSLVSARDVDWPL
jgi:hypothetical protein